jgi:type IX secretion system PorP/SprF family membrane protein
MKTINKVALGCITALISMNSLAQQAPEYSQYMYNHIIFNPAIAGSKPYAIIRGDIRDQWVGIEGHPRTQTISIDAPVFRNKVGLGAYFFNDRVGPVNRSGASLAYAYHFRVNMKMKIALAANGTYYTTKLKTDELMFGQQDLNTDNAINSNNVKSVYPNFGFGTYMYTRKYYAGFSVPELTRFKIDRMDNFAISQERHYYVMGGYFWHVVENLVIQPSFLVKYVKRAPVSVDVSTLFRLYRSFDAGLSYRFRDSFILLAGYTLRERLHLGYSYDFTMTDLSNYTSGTHELTFSYYIPYREREHNCTAYDDAFSSPVKQKILRSMKKNQKKMDRRAKEE